MALVRFVEVERERNMLLSLPLLGDGGRAIAVVVVGRILKMAKTRMRVWVIILLN